MTTSELMKAMADAGAPFDAILIAVRALEERDAQIAARDAETAEKRARDAARKRAERDASRNVRGQSLDNPATVQATPLSLPPNENNSNPPTHTPVNITTRAREAFPMPSGVDPQHWADFLANRKRKRTPNTQTAHKRLMDDLGRLARDAWTVPKLIEHAAAKGWAGIYDPTEAVFEPPPRQVKPPPSHSEVIRRKYASQ